MRSTTTTRRHGAACPASLTVGDETYRLRFLSGRHLLRDDGEDWQSIGYFVAQNERVLTLAGGMDAARLGDAMIAAIGTILEEQGREALDLFE